LIGIVLKSGGHWRFPTRRQGRAHNALEAAGKRTELYVGISALGR
jgi:hypothetical protein